MKIRIRMGGRGLAQAGTGATVAEAEGNMLIAADIDAIVAELASRDITVAGLTVTGDAFFSYVETGEIYSDSYTGEFDSQVNQLITDREGASLDVVVADGKLAKVPRHSNYVSPTDYPSVLKVVAAAGNITLDTTGLTMLKSDGKTAAIAFGSLVRDLAIGNVGVCESNTAKSIDGLISATYT